MMPLIFILSQIFLAYCIVSFILTLIKRNTRTTYSIVLKTKEGQYLHVQGVYKGIVSKERLIDDIIQKTPCLTTSIQVVSFLKSK